MSSHSVSFTKRPQTASISLEDDSDAAKKGKLKQGKPKGVAGLSLAGSSHSKQIKQQATDAAADVFRIATLAVDRICYKEIVKRGEISFNEIDSMLNGATLAFKEFTPSPSKTVVAIRQEGVEANPKAIPRASTGGRLGAIAGLNAGVAAARVILET
jgi:hypothetical protein